MTTETPTDTSKAITPAEATIKAAYLEELRFAKRQQWTITAAVVALIAGAYNVAKSLAPWEKVVAAIMIVVVYHLLYAHFVGWTWPLVARAPQPAMPVIGAKGITSGKGRLPAGEQQSHVWDV